MCWAWVRVSSGVKPASGSPRAAAYIFGAWVPPLEAGACNDKYLRAPILRGAWVPPLEDGACHDEHLQQKLEEKVVVVVVAAAAVVVVVVVRGGKLAFGCSGAHTFST